MSNRLDGLQVRATCAGMDTRRTTYTKDHASKRWQRSNEVLVPREPGNERAFRENHVARRPCGAVAGVRALSAM